MKLSAGLSQSVQVGKRAHYQLVNPSGSGKVLTVVFVEANCRGVEAYWTVRSYNTPLANEFSGICNQEFGAGGGVGKVYYDSLSGAVLGNIHADFFRKDGEPLRIDNPPIITLNPGRGVLFVCHTYDAATVITLEWTE